MLIVNSRFLTQPVTGVQRFAIELAKQLKDIYKDDIIFVSPQNIINKEVANSLNVKIIGKRIGHLWEQIDLPLYLYEIGEPLLLCLCSTAPVFYKNKISTLHDITYVRYPKTFSFKFNLLYRTIIPLILKTSKHILTVSQFSKDEITHYYHINNKKISIIHNAVSHNFKPTKDETLANEKYIIAVSSIKENKNFPIVLHSFLLAHKEIPNLKLYIIGDLKTNSFKGMDTTISIMSKHPNIKILGRVSDSELIKYYSNANAFIFPSLYEGFGIPVLEAQACGCPVISANSSSLPEVLKGSALICDPTSEIDFSHHIISIIQSPQLSETLIKKGYNNLKRFSWKSSANIISNIISNIENERIKV